MTVSVKSYIKFNGSYFPSNDSGIEVYTPWYSSGNASNRFSLNIYGADYNTDTKKLVLTWNTDAGKNATEIDLNDLVNTYKGSEHIIVETDGTIKVAEDVALDSDLTALETTLTGAIATKRTEAEVDAQIDA